VTKESNTSVSKTDLGLILIINIVSILFFVVGLVIGYTTGRDTGYREGQSDSLNNYINFDIIDVNDKRFDNEKFKELKESK